MIVPIHRGYDRLVYPSFIYATYLLLHQDKFIYIMSPEISTTKLKEWQMGKPIMKYQQISPVVEAIAYEPENQSRTQLVIEWLLDEKVEFTFQTSGEPEANPTLEIQGASKKYQANSGDYIIKDSLGWFSTMDASTFRQTYEAKTNWIPKRQK